MTAHKTTWWNDKRVVSNDKLISATSVFTEDRRRGYVIFIDIKGFESVIVRIRDVQCFAHWICICIPKPYQKHVWFCQNPSRYRPETPKIPICTSLVRRLGTNLEKPQSMFGYDRRKYTILIITIIIICWLNYFLKWEKYVF